jgi:hypothetical protein
MNFKAPKFVTEIKLRKTFASEAPAIKAKQNLRHANQPGK